MSTLRIMSNNQWKCETNRPAWEAMGMDCSPAVRERGFVRMYSELLPDLIGGQEISAPMADKLMCYMSEAQMPYSLLWGRDTPIIYRSDKLELIDSEFALYPESVPGFEGNFNNSLSKSWTLGVFRTKEDGKTLAFLTTHLWWMSSNPVSRVYQKGSDEARMYQLKICMDKLQKYQQKYHCPAVLVGDLNSRYNSAVVEYIFSQGYEHAHNIAVEPPAEVYHDHDCDVNGFGPYQELTFEQSIDHIFLKGHQPGAVLRFLQYSPEYYLPLSDHSPVYIDMTL